MLSALALFLVGTLTTSGADSRKTILFFGDSLTAGYGLDDPAQAFPGLIEQRIEAAQLPYRVVNAGLSGETTAGGLRRIDWVLRQPIEIFVLELGGNDGLRGLSPHLAEANLQAIIDKVRARDPRTKIILTGMVMPPSMGADFTRTFAKIYPDLAAKNQLILIPFLLDRVGGITSLNQADMIHPNREGHALLAATVWRYLQPLLQFDGATTAAPPRKR
jgi:acyl-CoA thioesterase-1